MHDNYGSTNSQLSKEEIDKLRASEEENIILRLPPPTVSPIYPMFFIFILFILLLLIIIYRLSLMFLSRAGLKIEFDLVGLIVHLSNSISMHLISVYIELGYRYF